MKSLSPSIFAGMKWDVQCSAAVPAEASNPEMLSALAHGEQCPHPAHGAPAEPRVATRQQDPPGDRGVSIGGQSR